MAGYQLKITLEDTKPPVWRRVIVPDGITFGNLHDVIQILFGWENMHLHDFSFPADLYPHIGPAEEMGEPFSDDLDELDEDEVYLDEYIESNPWIRYTYDFGDDWRHKIVLEKKVPDYEKRYPQVIKYKGANLEEDSGGVWGMEEEGSSREPFSMERVNTWMEKNLYFEPVTQAKEVLNEILDMSREIDPSRHPEKFMEGIREIVEQRKDGLDETSLEMLDETMDEIQMLLNIFSGNVAMGGRSSVMSRKLEQVEWYYPEDEEYSLTGIRAEVVKTASKRSWKEVLLDMQKEELQEFCEVLKIHYAKSWNKGKLCSEIVGELSEHPEFLYYILTKEGMKSVLDFAKASEGDYYGNLKGDAVKTLLSWGYFDVEFQIGVEPIMAVAVPEEVAALLSKLSKGNWKRECTKIEKATEGITRLLYYYGCIEFDKLYKIYNKVIHPMEEKAFYDYVYFAAVERDLIWYIAEEQKDLLWLENLEQEGIGACRENYVQDMEYYDLTLLDVERWKKGIEAVYPEWRELIASLCDEYGLPKEQVSEFIQYELYPSVMEGAGLADLISVAEELIPLEGIQERFRLWEQMKEIFLHTRIAGLKGYTREEVAEKRKENPFVIGAKKNEQSRRKVKDSAHMEETPLKYQREISEILGKRRNSPDTTAQEIEALLKKYNKNHYEGRYLLAMVYDQNGQSEKACQILEALVEDTEDPGLEKLLKEWKTKNK